MEGREKQGPHQVYWAKFCRPAVPCPQGYGLVPVHQLLGTGPHSRKRVVDKQAKLHLYVQPLLSARSPPQLHLRSSGVRFSLERRSVVPQSLGAAAVVGCTVVVACGLLWLAA